MNRALELDYEFEKFLRDNPTVYPQFRMLAVKLKAKGIDRWGASHLGSAALRDGMKSVTTGEKYALNNNFTSHDPRKLMAEEPEEFAGFFETRTLKAVKSSSPSPRGPNEQCYHSNRYTRPLTAAPSTCFNMAEWERLRASYFKTQGQRRDQTTARSWSALENRIYEEIDGQTKLTRYSRSEGYTAHDTRRDPPARFR